MIRNIHQSLFVEKNRVEREKQVALAMRYGSLLTVKKHSKKNVTKEDHFDVINKIVAMKLRDLPKNQLLIAENFITDTLF